MTVYLLCEHREVCSEAEETCDHREYTRTRQKAKKVRDNPNYESNSCLAIRVEKLRMIDAVT
jgi:hypothetical protein